LKRLFLLILAALALLVPAVGHAAGAPAIAFDLSSHTFGPGSPPLGGGSSTTASNSELPFTGLPVFIPLLAGFGLLTAGIGMWRRNRRDEGEPPGTNGPARDSERPPVGNLP
jgi:hypothetical protein